MFKFFRKKDNIDNNKVEAIEEIEINEPAKKIAFTRSQDELLESPSFSMLIQLNKNTEEFIVATDIDDLDEQNADLVGAFLSILTNGGANKVIIDALTSFSNNEEEETFVLNVLTQWKGYENLASTSKVAPKNKIDPTKIFNIRGGNP